VQADPKPRIFLYPATMVMVMEYTVVYLVFRISGFQDFGFAQKAKMGGSAVANAESVR